MSTILEFYVEKEKRELINTIGSAKYVSEEQKEAMIAVMEYATGHDAGDEESDLTDAIRDLQKKQKEYDYHDDEYQALDVRIDKKRKQLKDLKFKNR